MSSAGNVEREAVAASPPADEPAHVEIKGLTKRYTTRSGTIEALDDVSFRATRNSFVSIVGPSGCGKSTILKILFGVLDPTEGTVLVDGQIIASRQPRIGMVFQSPALPPWRSVLRNVLLPIDALGLRRADYEPRARELLRMAGLEGFEDRYPAELSGGMQQRVSICRALIHDPELLLMDEPFGALDALTRETMQLELLRIWRETGKTVLFVTHSIDEAVLLSDQIILMSPRPGRIANILTVDLPRPRDAETRANSVFQDLAHTLRTGLGVSSG